MEVSNMKHLSDYTEKATTELMKYNGAFFAFGNKQFEEKKQDGVKYVHLFGGLICPKDNAKNIYSGLDKIRSKGIAKDIAENGLNKIIHREFANYECQISMDYTDAKNSLSDYPITDEDLAREWKIYFQDCIDNDYF
jgi:hypothetical protein